MHKWITFSLKHPVSVILILTVLTLISFAGLKEVRIDSSTEAMMPKQSKAYQLNERAKEIFGDNKTFSITAIEASHGEELFSLKALQKLNLLVEELEEFKDFNPQLEKKRLTLLLTAGGIKETQRAEKKQENVQGSPESAADLEDELDNEILNNAPSSKKLPIPELPSDPDIWNLKRKISTDYHVVPSIPEKNFDYSGYTPVNISSLKKHLDPVACRQLDTLMLVLEINKPSDQVITKDEFSRILDQWNSLSRYKSMEIIKTFLNPVSGEDFIGTADELKQRKFLEKNSEGKFILPSNEQEFETYKKILLRNPAYKSLLYSINDKGTIRALAMTMLLRPLKNHDEIFNFFYLTIKKYNTAPLTLTPMGILVEQKYVKDSMIDDLKSFIPFVIIMIMISFFFHFRSIRGVILPTVTVLMATIFTFAIMGFAGIPITIVVNMLPPLLIAVGSSYSIHIYHQYLHDQEMIHMEGKRKGLLISMKHISLTVLLAAGTTFVGFLTLTTNQISSLRHFGIFAALGTLLAMAIASMLIPSVLSILKMPPKKKTDSITTHSGNTSGITVKIIEALSALSIHRPGTVLFLSLILISAFSWGITKIQIETAPIRMFKPSSYLYQSDLKMGELFDGTLTTNLIIDSGKKNGAKDPKFLIEIEKLRNWIISPDNRNNYHLLHTSSFSDVIKRMHMAMNNDDQRYYSIPESASTVTDYLEIYSGEDRDSDGRFDSLEQFTDSEYRYVNILIRFGSINNKILSTNIIKAGQEHIRKHASENPALNKYRIIQTGEASNLITLADLVVKGQVTSIILTLLIVALLIFFLFKNVKAGLLALIPISVSIIITYGFMGFFNIPLDIPKAILAAVALGIGVDDTIHMLKTLKHNIKKGLPINEAIEATHHEAGLAIIYTSLSLIIGFSILLLSDFVPGQYLGAMIVLTMVSTTIAALALLPAAIVFFKINLSEQSDLKIFRRQSLKNLKN